MFYNKRNIQKKFSYKNLDNAVIVMSCIFATHISSKNNEIISLPLKKNFITLILILHERCDTIWKKNSKSIKNKNIIKILSKKNVYVSHRCSKKVKYITKIYVSSDQITF